MAEQHLRAAEDLLSRARKAASNAHAPYSGFRVGCALRCGGDGAVFVGCNVENASLGLSLCAERAAVTAAIAAGRRDFEAMAVYAEGPDPPVPCGACRQFISEFVVELPIIAGNGARQQSFLLSDLLPQPFGRHNLG